MKMRLLIAILIVTFLFMGCKVLINPTPEIVVKYEDVVIPSIDGTLDFKDVFVGEEKTLDLVIENTGNGTLNLTGSPDLIEIKDSTAAVFSIDQSSTDSKLKTAEFTTFSITYKPFDLSEHSARLEIQSNDVDYEPYTINLIGRGVLPEINVKQGNDDVESGTGFHDFGIISVWDTSPEVTFTIENLGSCDLLLTNTSSLVSVTGKHASMFFVDESSTDKEISPGSETSFTVVFKPVRLGLKEATLEIYNNDTDENPYEIKLMGTGADPDINVVDSEGTDILNNTGEFDFGDVIITTTKTADFGLQNLGNYDLEMTGSPDIQIIGADKDAFTVTWQPLTLVAAGTQSLFKIEFHPTELRTYTAKVYIPNSDFDEDPYTFTIIGRGTEPEIEIQDSHSNNIACTTGSFDFGTVFLNQTLTETFTITNIGSHVLEFSGMPSIQINDNYYDVFEITIQPGSSVMPGQSTTFEVSFTPNEYRTYSAYIEILNNDLDEMDFIFTIAGMGAAPDISVKDSHSNEIENNVGSYDFGSVIRSDRKNETFEISNSGTANLNLTGTQIVTISGAGASAFTVITQPTTPVSSLSSVSFEIEFNPTTAQDFTATVTIGNDDPDESPYEFTIYGTCTAIPMPEINVKQNNHNIRCNTGVYSFSPVAYGFRSAKIEFTIENLGTSVLSLAESSAIAITGTDSSEFSLDTSSMTTTIGVGSSTKFTIGFTPSNTGNKSATVSIINDDSNENPYVFDISASSFEYVEGDVNGDGICDLAISALNSDFIYNDSGSVCIFFGKNNIPSNVKASDANVQIKGSAIEDHIGHCVTTSGDVNNDGIHDIIISSSKFKDNDVSKGAVFIFFGRLNWERRYEIGDADVTIFGDNENDLFGTSISTGGDIDDDGYDDIVVGAPGDDDGGTLSGCAFVFYGRTSWLSNYSASDANVKLVGAQASSRLGFSVNSEGDINNDGYADIIMSCIQYGSNQIYIVFGSQSMSNVFNTANADVIIDSGSAVNIRDSRFSSAGDVNGDGIDDLLIGSWLDGYQHIQNGCAYIFFGRSIWHNNLTMNDADVKLYGDAEYVRFGIDVRIVKDINGDGIDDVLIGAYQAEDFAVHGGCAYLFTGTTQWLSIVDTVKAYARYFGDENEMQMGYSVTSCDINDDSYVDIIISAVNAKNSNDLNTGNVYVYLGSSNPAGNFKSFDAGIRIEGAQENESFGSDVSGGS